MTKKKICTKEDFKNCFINLSNASLNGEVTDEVYNRLKSCFCKIISGKNNFSEEYYCDGDKWGNDIIIIWDDVIGNYSGKLIGYENFRHFKEVSIYDILGMEVNQTKRRVKELKGLIEHRIENKKNCLTYTQRCLQNMDFSENWNNDIFKNGYAKLTGLTEAIESLNEILDCINFILKED